MSNYSEETLDDAQRFAREMKDQIVEQIMDDSEASTDFNNDYAGMDDYHHSSHVDKSYDLSESAEVLSQLSDYEETDSGLWDGQEPRRAIATQAAYTYGNAVWSKTVDIVNDINSQVADLFIDLKDEWSSQDDARSAANVKALEALEEEREKEKRERVTKLVDEILQVKA